VITDERILQKMGTSFARQLLRRISASSGGGESHLAPEDSAAERREKLPFDRLVVDPYHDVGHSDDSAPVGRAPRHNRLDENLAGVRVLLEENAHASHACSDCDDEGGEWMKGERQREGEGQESKGLLGQEISGRRQERF